MTAEITPLIDIFDRGRGSPVSGHVSLIAENDEAEEVVRESANSARHVELALSALEELRDWQKVFEDSD